MVARLGFVPSAKEPVLNNIEVEIAEAGSQLSPRASVVGPQQCEQAARNRADAGIGAPIGSILAG